MHVTFMCSTADLKGNTQRYYEIHSVLLSVCTVGRLLKVYASVAVLFEYLQSPILTFCRARLKCDGTRAETRFGLSAKRTSPFKLAGGGVSSVDYWQPKCAHQQ